MSIERERLRQLDGLRGVAALLVAFFHLCLYQSPWVMEQILGVAPVIARSYLFVDWFFILSGFVLGLRYFERFRGGVCLDAFLNFIYKRFIRLYPLHLATLLILAGLHWGLTPLFPGLVADPGQALSNNFTFVSNLLLLHSSGLGDQGCYNCSSWNYPAWSISVEWLSYMFLPGFFALAARARKSAVLASACLMALLYFAVERPIGHLDVSSWQGLLRCATGMSLGALLWEVYKKGPQAGGTRARAQGLFLVAALPFAFAYFPSDTLLLVAMAWAVLIGARLKRGGVLTSRGLLWLGDRSYAIYMVHAVVQAGFSFVLRAGWQIAPQQLSPSMQVASAFFGLAASLMLADIAHQWIELPCASGLRRIGSKIWRRSKLLAAVKA